MKVKRLVVQNTLSYQARTEFVFENGMNIIIGPNGGGKTNMQRILALVLSEYFIHQYDFLYNDQEAKIQQIDPWTRRVLERNLQRFMGDNFVGDPSDQLIELELAPEPFDIQNIRTIGDNLERFNKELSVWERRFDTYPPATISQQIADASSLTYRILNLDLLPQPEKSPAWGFAEYLRTFFIFMRLANTTSRTMFNYWMPYQLSGS